MSKKRKKVQAEKLNFTPVYMLGILAAVAVIAIVVILLKKKKKYLSDRPPVLGGRFLQGRVPASAVR